MSLRSEMRKLFSILLALVAIVLLVPACSNVNRVTEHPVKGEIVEAHIGDLAQTVHWIVATDGAASLRYAGFMVDPLAVFDNQFKLQLRCLAKDIDVSQDGLTYTITIRDDLKWTDGSKVTSNDYVYTLKNLMFSDWLNYADRAKWQEVVADQQVFVSPEVVSDTTFKIVRKTVDPDFLYLLYDLRPYPKTIAVHYENKLEAFTQAEEFVNMSYCGNLGAYKYVAWTNQDGFVVQRNPDYYLGKESGAPFFKQYRIKQYGLQQLLNDDLEAGKITYAFVEPDQANYFRSKDSLNVYTVPNGFYVYLAYNERDNGWEGLKDARVRQAISMVIDKPAVASQLYLGYADPALSFIPPYSPLYDESLLQKYGMTPAADQQKAIDLIKSAGYEQKEFDGKMKFVNKDGNPIKLLFAIDMASDFEQNMAILMRVNLMSIGLDIDPRFSTREIIFGKALMNKVPGSDQTPSFNNGPHAIGDQPWDLTILSSHANPLSIEGSGEFFTSTGRYNLFAFYNDNLDALYKRAKSAEALSFEGKKKIYGEIAKLISEQQPVDFLVYYKDNYAMLRGVKGVEPGINMEYNYQFWYPE
jgi:peptide/nickel transport system substrate-binding protein